jgi:RHS repeat-associated protein
VAVIEGGVVSYVRTDHIGRPVFATNATTGVKTWTASYDPFGGVRTVTGAPISARFPGQWFQAESGLHQNWMRDYDPTTGRYLQADPLGLVDGASVYGYAMQSPMMYTDPRGEDVADFMSSPAGRGAMSTALGTSAVDGPLPFGEAAGLCIIAAVVVYCAADGYYCRGGNDDCQDQYDEDTAWCARNARGREYLGCIARAEDNLFTCKRGGPRKPRVPEIYEQ